MEHAYFLKDVREARDRFMDTFQGWDLQTHPIGLGPGLEVATAYRAPRSGVKRNLLTVFSGTHGLEVRSGDAMQYMIGTEYAPTDDTGILLFHAHNPYGAFNNRRTNENGVDLNRNAHFDWTQAVDAEGLDLENNRNLYDKVQALLNPPGEVADIQLESRKFMEEFNRLVEAHGEKTVLKFFATGQYTNPHGLFYGGTQHEPSVEVDIDVTKQYGQGYQRIVTIDNHTGIGEKFAMENYPETQHSADVLQGVIDLEPVPYASNGGIPLIPVRLFPDAEHIAITAEKGTLPIREVATALWLMRRMDQYGAVNDNIKREVEQMGTDAFHLDEVAWMDNVALHHHTTLDAFGERFELFDKKAA